MSKEIRAEIQELLLHSVFGITQIFQTNAKESKKKKNCVGGDVGKKWDGSLRERELNVWTYH